MIEDKIGERFVIVDMATKLSVGDNMRSIRSLLALTNSEPIMVKCGDCGGTGVRESSGSFHTCQEPYTYPCPTCKGTGYRAVTVRRLCKEWGECQLVRNPKKCPSGTNANPSRNRHLNDCYIRNLYTPADIPDIISKNAILEWKEANHEREG